MKILARAGSVTLEKGAAADEDLADFATRRHLELFVKNSNFRAVHGLSGGFRCCSQVLGRSGRDHARLCGVVIVVDHVAELVHERGHHLGPHPRAGRRREPQRTAGVTAPHLFGKIHDPVEHHRRDD